MELGFSGEIVVWRGPAPHHFVAAPPGVAAEIRDVAAEVTYGWGVVPVTVHLGRTSWTTSLFPRDNTYLVPLKAAVRAAERIGPGDTVALRLVIGGQPVG